VGSVRTNGAPIDMKLKNITWSRQTEEFIKLEDNIYRVVRIIRNNGIRDQLWTELDNTLYRRIRQDGQKRVGRARKDC